MSSILSTVLLLLVPVVYLLTLAYFWFRIRIVEKDYQVTVKILKHQQSQLSNLIKTLNEHNIVVNDNFTTIYSPKRNNLETEHPIAPTVSQKPRNNSHPLPQLPQLQILRSCNSSITPNNCNINMFPVSSETATPATPNNNNRLTPTITRVSNPLASRPTSSKYSLMHTPAQIEHLGDSTGAGVGAHGGTVFSIKSPVAARSTLPTPLPMTAQSSIITVVPDFYLYKVGTPGGQNTDLSVSESCTYTSHTHQTSHLSNLSHPSQISAASASASVSEPTDIFIDLKDCASDITTKIISNKSNRSTHSNSASLPENATAHIVPSLQTTFQTAQTCTNHTNPHTTHTHTKQQQPVNPGPSTATATCTLTNIITGTPRDRAATPLPIKYVINGHLSNTVSPSVLDDTSTLPMINGKNTMTSISESNELTFHDFKTMGYFDINDIDDTVATRSYDSKRSKKYSKHSKSSKKTSKTSKLSKKSIAAHLKQLKQRSKSSRSNKSAKSAKNTKTDMDPTAIISNIVNGNNETKIENKDNTDLNEINDDNAISWTHDYNKLGPPTNNNELSVSKSKSMTMTFDKDDMCTQGEGNNSVQFWISSDYFASRGYNNENSKFTINNNNNNTNDVNNMNKYGNNRSISANSKDNTNLTMTEAPTIDIVTIDGKVITTTTGDDVIMTNLDASDIPEVPEVPEVPQGAVNMVSRVSGMDNTHNTRDRYITRDMHETDGGQDVASGVHVGQIAVDSTSVHSNSKMARMIKEFKDLTSLTNKSYNYRNDSKLSTRTMDINGSPASLKLAIDMPPSSTEHYEY